MSGYQSMTSLRRIRAAVVERAAGLCESCGVWCGKDGHLDHQFGRAKVKQTEANCWLLCVRCDDHKTRNYPNAGSWLRRFIVHARVYGFEAEQALAATKLNTLQAKGLVSR